MKCLIMDTSNTTCSAGVYEDKKELSYRLSLETRTHSETFMPLVHEVMEEAKTKYEDLSYYGITVGPGSFTGIRIGMAFVKGLASVNSIPCVPVSSVDALARSVEVVDTPIESTILISCFEARNNRVFAGVFKADDYMRIIPDNAYNSDELIGILLKLSNLDKTSFIVLGNGADTVRKAVERNEFDKKIKYIDYASGAVILPKGVMKASQAIIDSGFQPISALELEPVYCAKAQAERLRSSK
ncbi:MAG: tRNA (adenosine(37)-N6)-threonylcarbamoyltransferase complex dimerization subunit type 1 TsaB [Clostridia bacterium]|nr:tRNA (adenosine(37)-N6)-threonylcarbamoyltransferase complex dimerization subunit type 1 TsaB [Clostridia bacterium]